MGIKTPAEISQAALAAGVAKSRLAFGTMVLMGFLAGAYIGMGGYFMLVVTQDAAQFAGVGISKMLGGVVFSLGLFLVLTAGAELVTGNCLMPIACLSKKISFASMMRNICAVYFANFAGALFFAALIFASGLISEKCGAAALSLAAMKSSLPAGQMLIRGVLCNWFVCLAVWIAFGAQDTAGKFVAALLPISAFVAMGFEHCVAYVFHPAGHDAERRSFPRAHRRGVREESILCVDRQRHRRGGFRRALLFPDFPQGASESLVFAFLKNLALPARSWAGFF